jgi:hypothetical protein
VNSQTATAPAAEIGIATRRLESYVPAAREVARGRPTAMPPLRLLLAWALGSFIVGSIVAAGISFTRQGIDVWPVFFISVLFAEVVGFTALLSARLLFPLFERLPYALNLALQVFTLFAGTLFGSVMILTAQPYFTLARLRTVAVIVLVNALLSVIVGIALHTYDSMRHQIEQQYQALREKEAMERWRSPARCSASCCRAPAR